MKTVTVVNKVILSLNLSPNQKMVNSAEEPQYYFTTTLFRTFSRKETELRKMSV